MQNRAECEGQTHELAAALHHALEQTLPGQVPGAAAQAGEQSHLDQQREAPGVPQVAPRPAPG